ncbi:MAG: coenzyme F420-0:L-glutamate ligase [Candidatus Dadabacteria bacterium]|nr:coenzyme F420-0:L-glutamate ligase [Candidatus Dadabacteria bacterium]NIS08739.1 coenzyme F420-0:L-glutamate ligase [Candidatus Dadabacteria bacterium]NIV42623.1 coenzyme F420-0:L-glutamate ligase [Candidatus Dadabacteria bacterium]NIX15425.1 coenzyme F420-0:L-glutamate ligase [Candidatus Dadabacteria bacterium]NIY22088.1 coenzyme F420-0:L-glutamate ligase [Candidatus Dadabacteria bacterium]
MSPKIELIPVTAIPEIKEGDNLSEILLDALKSQQLDLEEKDIVVIAQKIVSKAEGKVVDLKEVEPTPFAEKLGEELLKDPRVVEVILGETRRIVKMQRKTDTGVMVVENKDGLVLANAGVDSSNVPDNDKVTLLPEDSDGSAQRIAVDITNQINKDVAVIITDTVGRPWREGLTEIAIGTWGINPLKDYRSQKDKEGYELTATLIAIADEIAGAAGLLMGKNDAVPVVVVRGYEYEFEEIGSKSLIRDPRFDLFR